MKGNKKERMKTMAEVSEGYESFIKKSKAVTKNGKAIFDKVIKKASKSRVAK